MKNFFLVTIFLIYSLDAVRGNATIINKPSRCDATELVKNNNKDMLLDKEVFIQAKKIQYNDRTKVYKAQENIEIYYDNRYLKADYLEYDPVIGKGVAKGNVSLYDFTTDTTIDADNIILNQDFSVAIAKGVKALKGKNIRATASSVNRQNKNITTFYNVNYTPCTFVPKKGEPLWSVSAEKVTDNEETQNVTYKNASLNILGTPIVTLPRFIYPRPGSKRRSGFLAPEFQVESNNGFMASVPYFYALNESQDLTINPVYYSENNPLLRNHYRHKSDFGYFEADTAFTFSEKRNNNNIQTETNTFRGSILSTGRYQLNDAQYLGFDLNRVSDDTFLRRFDLNDPVLLQNRVFVSQNDRYNDLYISAYAFQVTDGITNEDTVPMILPFVNYQKQLEKPFLDGDVYLKSNLMGVHRDDGLDTRRAINAVQWVKNINLPLGVVLEFDNELRGDLYHTSQGFDPSDSRRAIENGFTARVLPRSSAKFSLPFVKRTDTSIQVIEPAVQTVWSPYGGNPDNIPNEDGFATEFDATGLFDSQRFYGYDLVENGPRLNTGVRYLYHIPYTGGFETQFGQSYRLKPENRFASYTGLDGKTSDYVGRFVVNYQNYVHLTHRYRLKNDSFGLGLSDLTLDSGNDWVRLYLSHFSIDDYDAGNIFNNSEQFTTGLRVSADKNWHIMSGYRQNIQTTDTLETSGGIIYTDECLIASATVGREYWRLNDLEPTTSFRFRIRLLTSGNPDY